MNAVSVLEGILSDGEREKLRELRELAEVRIDTHKVSLEEANQRLQAARVRNDKAAAAYREALIHLQPDPDDDIHAESEKAQKFEKIEAEYLEAGAAYRTAVLRAGWELRESQKLTG